MSDATCHGDVSFPENTPLSRDGLTDIPVPKRYCLYVLKYSEHCGTNILFERCTNIRRKQRRRAVRATFLVQGI